LNDWVKGKYYALKADQEVPQAKDLAPETDLTINFFHYFACIQML